METIEAAHIGLTTGVIGDFRGAVRPGKSPRRQISILARQDWEAALAEVGASVFWAERRANLFVDGLDLPRSPGARLRIGATVVVEITGECDPCRRMDEVLPGLNAALVPDWRGGRLARVVAEGHVHLGESVTVLD
jgi:MOSC domain-containing protein YiiM